MDQKDLKQISDLLDSKFAAYDKKMDSKFATQDRRLGLLETNLVSVIDGRIDLRVGKLEQKIFEWKSEIIDAVDSMAKEIRDEREFRDISSH